MKFQVVDGLTVHSFERRLHDEVRCDKCHTHYIFVDDDGDDCDFISCEECGYSREATEDDFVN